MEVFCYFESLNQGLTVLCDKYAYLKIPIKMVNYYHSEEFFTLKCDKSMYFTLECVHCDAIHTILVGRSVIMIICKILGKIDGTR